MPGAPLDARFTFDTFVVGKPNELAHAAARRVAEGGPVSFNPLFLYGGVGLGKTHLMHAIAHELQSRQPDLRVLYLSAEQFMYRFVQALRDQDFYKSPGVAETIDWAHTLLALGRTDLDGATTAGTLGVVLNRPLGRRLGQLDGGQGGRVLLPEDERVVPLGIEPAEQPPLDERESQCAGRAHGPECHVDEPGSRGPGLVVEAGVNDAAVVRRLVRGHPRRVWLGGLAVLCALGVVAAAEFSTFIGLLIAAVLGSAISLRKVTKVDPASAGISG